MDETTLRTLCELSPFVTGPSATSDLHAGGVFFCVIYRRELTFHPNRLADLNFHVLDNWRPSGGEVQDLNSKSCSGKVTSNSRGYIEISFPNMQFTGCECDNLSRHLAFHIFGSYVYPPTIEKLFGNRAKGLPRHFSDSAVFFSEQA